MKPLQSTGLTNVGSAYVHTGFLYAYNVVASTVLKTVKAQAAAYPSYTIVVTGHSLGGAVASLAAISIKSALPNSSLKLYTFGMFLYYIDIIYILNFIPIPRPTSDWKCRFC